MLSTFLCPRHVSHSHKKLFSRLKWQERRWAYHDEAHYVEQMGERQATDLSLRKKEKHRQTW